MCVSSSPVRSTCPDGMRCPGDLLDETQLKNKEEGDRGGRESLQRLRHRCDLHGIKGEGLTRESLSCSTGRRKSGPARWGVFAPKTLGKKPHVPQKQACVSTPTVVSERSVASLTWGWIQKDSNWGHKPVTLPTAGGLRGIGWVVTQHWQGNWYIWGNQFLCLRRFL